jgi:hypothetical protein
MEKSKRLIRTYTFTEKELQLNLRIKGTIDSVSLLEEQGGLGPGQSNVPATITIKTSEIQRD